MPDIGRLALALALITVVLDRWVNPWLRKQAKRPSRERIEYLNSVLTDYDPQPGDSIRFTGPLMTITRPSTGDTWNIDMP